MSVVGADTDLLRGEQLEPAYRRLARVRERFADEVAANMPPGHVRTDTDREIQGNLGNQVELVNTIFDGFLRLASGDTESVGWLGTFLTRVDETNTDLAGQLRPNTR